MENKNYFNDTYLPSIIRWGRATNLVGVVFAFFPALVCFFVFGLRPAWSAIFAGFLMQASVSGVFWFAEPISYFPVLGVPATYMTFLSGNCGNLRLPAAAAALEASGIEPGTEKGTIISTIGVAVSIVVNLIFLTAGIVLGSSVLSMLPAGVIMALNNLLPALFGAMLGQQFVPNPKIATVAIILAGGMLLLSKYAGVPSFCVIIVAVFGSILIGRKIVAAENAKKSA